MWENAAPAPPPNAGEKTRRRPGGKSDEELVLWAQIVLCLLVLAVVLLARLLNWPLLTDLRVTWEQVTQPEQELYLGEGRNLSKFTEQTAQTLAEKVGTLLDQTKNAATEKTGLRLSHGKADTVPSGAREETYLPQFALTFPLAGHTATKTSGYGWRTDPMGGSGSDFHLGNDLAAAQGTAVLAAADGVVRYAGEHSSYGNYVRILHANGDETLYAHLQYLFVHTGQTVSAGMCLGMVGQTGNATGPHLHFELLHKGIRYDPSEALQIAA